MFVLDDDVNSDVGAQFNVPSLRNVLSYIPLILRDSLSYEDSELLEDGVIDNRTFFKLVQTFCNQLLNVRVYMCSTLS